MRQRNPPALAIWLLDRKPGERNEALAGDLLEEFRSGRTVAWYWRQAIAAVAIGCSRQIRINREAAAFAALWSMLVPAWLLAIVRFEEHSAYLEHMVQVGWPWSTVCDLGLLLATNLIFIWGGIFLYHLPQRWRSRRLNNRSFRRDISASVPVLIALWAALIVMPKYFLQQPIGAASAAQLNPHAQKGQQPGHVAPNHPQMKFGTSGDRRTNEHSSSAERSATCGHRPSWFDCRSF